MRHQYSGLYDFAGNGLHLQWLILAIILIAAAVFIISRKKHSQEVRKHETFGKSAGDDFTHLVLAMLSQKGEGITQTEISGNIGLPSEATAGKLLAMEKEGLIKRIWTNREYTYIINKK
jgi:uncharacterized membrane protein